MNPLSSIRAFRFVQGADINILHKNSPSDPITTKNFRHLMRSASQIAIGRVAVLVFK